ncbi:alpha/beta-hydrolase [Lentinula aciculospora]|uniref:Carboxylic ester hydrolase n=1 Tax=Lentinula aciculospora TaxID=153920 RepID=A0A9W9ADG4_9AGAR|nr:alpha/beta-hydrolase [Lentinula aciculospora]
MFPFALSIWCAIVALSRSTRASPLFPVGDVVDTGYIQYHGNRSFENTVAYLGIPYAEPPLGDRRFRAPLPLDTERIKAENHGEVVDATTYPDFCVQGTTGAGDAGGAGTEDCLKLNVYAPFGAKLGDDCYVYGNPANWPFDSWINQSPNVVVVSVYYRLDSFGFLAVPELDDTRIGDFNAGFQDQIQSLKWIKSYIASFGGNPNKVTINGQSAGGGSVELHLVAKNQAEVLFSGAIVQSVYRTPTPTPAQQQPLFAFYAEAAGCGNGSVIIQLPCLRNASISALARAQDAAPYNAFHPVVDGKIITDYPSNSILNGQFVQVPLIVGATSNETLFGGTDFVQALQEAFPGLSSGDLEEFVQEYPLSEFDSTSQQFQVATGESILICSREILGGAYANVTQAWTYRYNQPNPTSGSPAVGHAAENWMMFNGINTGFNGTGTFTPMSPVEKSFAAELIAYWLSFVRSGDPNVFKLDRSPTWERYLTIRDNLKERIVLQQPANNSTTESGSFIEMEPSVESGRCAFVATKSRQEQN